MSYTGYAFERCPGFNIESSRNTLQAIKAVAHELKDMTGKKVEIVLTDSRDRSAFNA